MTHRIRRALLPSVLTLAGALGPLSGPGPARALAEDAGAAPGARAALAEARTAVRLERVRRDPDRFRSSSYACPRAGTCTTTSAVPSRPSP